MKSLLIIQFSLFLGLLIGQNPYAYLSFKEFSALPQFNQEIDLKAVDIKLIEAGVFHLSNLYRTEKDKNSLGYNEEMSDAAYLHSKEMTDKKFFDHYNRFTKELSSLDKRAEFVGFWNYTSLAENIFYGYLKVNNLGTYQDLCEFIVQNFVSSKSHRQNILANDVNLMGCGIAFESKFKDGYLYFNITQDFAGR